jgi:hypothetical protein
MRAVSLLLTGGLGLLITACGNPKVDPGRPVLKKELLVGKWKVTEDNEETQYVQDCEFADGKLKMTVKGLKEPVPGTYSWADDYTLDVTFQANDDLKKAFKTAIQALKKPRLAKIGDAKDHIPDSQRKSVEEIPNELPATQKYKVGITEGKQNTLLTLDNGTVVVLDFKKVK